jgi:hypothetical protein
MRGRCGACSDHVQSDDDAGPSGRCKLALEVPKPAHLVVAGLCSAFLAWGMGATVPTAAPSAEPSPAAGSGAPATPMPLARSRLGETTARHPLRVPIAGKGATRASIGSDEVTVGRFRACVKAGACKSAGFLADTGHPCNWMVEDRDDHPMNCVDWFGASAFCKFDGGRLCKADEWFAACRGPDDRDYPYGARFDRGACLAQPGPAKIEMGTEPVGSRKTCEGGTPGVHDMAGNVSEWVDECKDSYCHFYGGSYLANEPLEDFASCKHVCAGNQKTLKSSTLGFRCCYD